MQRLMLSGAAVVLCAGAVWKFMRKESTPTPSPSPVATREDSVVVSPQPRLMIRVPTVVKMYPTPPTSKCTQGTAFSLLQQTAVMDAAQYQVNNTFQPRDEDATYRPAAKLEQRLLRFLREEMLHKGEHEYYDLPPEWTTRDTPFGDILSEIEQVPAFTVEAAEALLWTVATHLPIRHPDDVALILLCVLRIPARKYAAPADPASFSTDDDEEQDGGNDMMRHYFLSRNMSPWSVRRQLLNDLSPAVISLSHERIASLLEARIASILI